MRWKRSKSSKADTSLYVTGLPKSVGQFSVEDRFRKYGKLKNLKLYKTASGENKGDAPISGPMICSTACVGSPPGPTGARWAAGALANRSTNVWPSHGAEDGGTTSVASAIGGKLRD